MKTFDSCLHFVWGVMGLMKICQTKAKGVLPLSLSLYDSFIAAHNELIHSAFDQDLGFESRPFRST
jgi:hypothetical protein